MLASRLQLLASDGELRRRLGREGRKTAEKLYNGDRLVSSLLGLYGKSAGRPFRPEVETVGAGG